jgi:hypothetical protein
MAANSPPPPRINSRQQQIIPKATAPLTKRPKVPEPGPHHGDVGSRACVNDRRHGIGRIMKTVDELNLRR